MITMNEFVDLRMQQHIAHEIYRHQIMQRIPDPFPPLVPIHIPRHIILPSRVSLPGVEVTLQNDDLWKQFHHIGTEMIITKSGRRMFPSMRLSISGLEDETNYCVLLEMVPIGDCRYKFSGSQWVPAGGAEPQSPQRMYLHTDSPASGAHWQAQPILFNKVKLTNNTLDNNGHIVLASMHKYQPRIHIIQTSDPTQIPWSPQQSYFFAETEFVAVTAYQNDRITKLKIDNNPFAKGFRETGQSRCKRKMSSSPDIQLVDLSQRNGVYDVHRSESDRVSQSAKRIRSTGSTCSISSLDEVVFTSISSNSSSGKNSPTIDFTQDMQPRTSNDSTVECSQPLTNSSFVDLAYSYFMKPHPAHFHPLTHHNTNELFSSTPSTNYSSVAQNSNEHLTHTTSTFVDIVDSEADCIVKTQKLNDFSISAILGSKS